MQVIYVTKNGFIFHNFIARQGYVPPAKGSEVMAAGCLREITRVIEFLKPRQGTTLLEDVADFFSKTHPVQIVDLDSLTAQVETQESRSKQLDYIERSLDENSSPRPEKTYESYSPDKVLLVLTN